MAISALPTAPSRSDSPSDFVSKADAFVASLSTFQSQANALAASMENIIAGGAVAIPYTFSTTTTDSDPGAGVLRLDNATQNAATTIRADLLGSDANTWTSALDTFDDSDSIVKGQIRLADVSDPTKFLLFNVTALAAPSGYRNITVACVGYSAASPFANGASLLLWFTRTGDKGATGGSYGTASVSGSETLTASSSHFRTVTPSAKNQAATLPDATTIQAASLGTSLWRYENLSDQYAYAIKDSAATIIGFCMPMRTVEIVCLSNATAAGQWRFKGNDDAYAAGVFPTNRMFSNSTVSSGAYQQILAADEQTAVVFWATGANLGGMVIREGRVVGTPNSNLGGPTAGSHGGQKAIRLTSTTYAVAVVVSGTGALYMIHVSVDLTSGVFTTDATNVTLMANNSSSASDYFDISSYSGATIFWASYNGGTNTKCGVVTLSGTTLANTGTTQTWGANPSLPLKCVALSDTLVVMCHGTQATRATQSAGNIAAPATPLAVSTNVVFGLFRYDATRAVVLHRAASAPYTPNLIVLTDNGTAVTQTATLAATSDFSFSGSNYVVSQVRTGRYVIFGRETGQPQALTQGQYFTFDGSSLAFERPFSFMDRVDSYDGPAIRQGYAGRQDSINGLMWLAYGAYFTGTYQTIYQRVGVTG